MVNRLFDRRYKTTTKIKIVIEYLALILGVALMYSAYIDRTNFNLLLVRFVVGAALLYIGIKGVFRL